MRLSGRVLFLGGAYFDGQVVVEEGLVAGDGGAVAFGLGVGPDGVGELAAVRVDGPVGGRALVRAEGVVVGGRDEVGPDVVQGHVHLGQDPGLVQEHGAGGVGHGLAAEL